MLLCPQTEFQEELYALLQKSVIKVPHEQIKQYYSAWSDNFESIDSQNKFILEKEDISDEQSVPDNSRLHGIDLPIWFNKPDTKLRKIMLLGIDPLRNKKIFENYNATEESQVILGTPYALHDIKMRNGRTKNYGKFIENLSKDNFVYVTDLYKTFFLVNNIRSYDFYKTTSNYSNNLLQKEIKLINPDLIITLGGESYQNLLGLKRKPQLTKEKIDFETLQKFENTTKVLPMVHLSARKQSVVDFIQINKFELEDNNYGEAYFNIINQFLQYNKKIINYTN